MDYKSSIIQILTAKFKPTELKVIDSSNNCGTAFQITIESVSFSGVTLLNQHKMVRSAISDIIDRIHSVEITTKVPVTSSK